MQIGPIQGEDHDIGNVHIVDMKEQEVQIK